MSLRLVACLFSLITLVGLGLSCTGDSTATGQEKIPEKVSYNFHIRPILSDKCFKCHGPDGGHREAGLRLDIADSAYAPLKETKGGFALVPGKPDASELYKRITSTDTGYVMPTPESHLGSLTAYEQRLFKKWIEQGARYESHWAFTAPVKSKPPAVYANYACVNAGLTVADQQSTSANASRVSRRFSDITNPANEPMILLGYAEQEFLIAEAISRNWITGAGTAEDHYNNGIRASMEFYGIGSAAINTYLGGSNVVFNPANALQMIITQKYIALFMQSGWEAFFEQRRTGIPTLNVGPGTYNNRQVPKRWLYPQSEYDYNKDNVEAAVTRQYSGNDNVNGVMWLLQ